MGPSDLISTDKFSLPIVAQEIFKDIKRKSELNIVIWGPCFSKDPKIQKIYEKKKQIQKIIGDLGHNIVIGEEDELVKKLQKSGLNLYSAEYIEATNADYIVCFMASPGSIGEVHDFATKFTHKMMICINAEYNEGYSAGGILSIFEGKNGKLDWFKYPEDIDECHLAGRVIKQIQRVRQAKEFEIIKTLK